MGGERVGRDELAGNRRSRGVHALPVVALGSALAAAGGDVKPLVEVVAQLARGGRVAASHARVALQPAIDVLLQKLDVQ